MNRACLDTTETMRFIDRSPTHKCYLSCLLPFVAKLILSQYRVGFRTMQKNKQTNYNKQNKSKLSVQRNPKDVKRKDNPTFKTTCDGFMLIENEAIQVSVSMAVAGG